MPQRKSRLWLELDFSSMNIPKEMQVLSQEERKVQMNKTHLHGASVCLRRAGGVRTSFKLENLNTIFMLIVFKFFLILKLKHEKSCHCFSWQVQGQQQTTWRVNFVLCVRALGESAIKHHARGKMRPN